jgi:hypothetical protein
LSFLEKSKSTKKDMQCRVLVIVVFNDQKKKTIKLG